MVNELSNSKGMSLEDRPMPSREPSWNEASEAIKCERLRTRIKQLERMNSKLMITIIKLQDHQHGPNGNILVSLGVSTNLEGYPTEERPSSLRGNNNEDLSLF